MRLLGSGIGYSWSPAMQNAAFAAAGLDWTYELADVDASELEEAVAALRDPAVAGANVTIPHKLAVLSMLDAIDPLVERTGAVNTIVNNGGRLRGHNTDVAGIAAALAAVAPAPGLALVLGAGGSARAAVAALGGFDVTVASRSGTAVGGARTLAWEARGYTARAAAVVVNATPLGRAGEVPLDLEDLNPAGALVDLVYAPGGTPLMLGARARGLRTAGGFAVLAAQGAAAFEVWTGRRAPLAEMRAALPADA